MWLKSLRLYQYRNLVDAELNFAPQLNVFVGRNGQGKTNLIEAISLLSYGRSFRTTNQRELIKWEAGEASVFGVLETETADVELGLAIQPKGKRPYINAKEAESLADFVGRLLSITFAPDDLELVKGGPLYRRRFLDRHLVDLDPTMMNQLIGFARALKHKNALLKSGTATQEEVRIWNRSLLPHAIAITNARIQLIALLSRAADEVYQTFATQDGPLTLRLKSTLLPEPGALAGDTAEQTLDSAVPREISRNTTLIGPHRDELVLALGGREARSFASQGQTRSIVLALKLGMLQLIEEKRSMIPLVLLDDVDSELDSGRSEALHELVFRPGRQVFITGTQFGAKVQKGARVFEITNGNIKTF